MKFQPPGSYRNRFFYAGFYCMNKWNRSMLPMLQPIGIRSMFMVLLLLDDHISLPTIFLHMLRLDNQMLDI